MGSTVGDGGGGVVMSTTVHDRMLDRWSRWRWCWRWFDVRSMVGASRRDACRWSVFGWRLSDVRPMVAVALVLALV